MVYTSACPRPAVLEVHGIVADFWLWHLSIKAIYKSGMCIPIYL